MKFRHLIDIDGEIEEVGHRAGGVVHTGEAEADRLDVDGETVGEAGEGAFLRDVHLLPAVMVVSHIKGEEFCGDDFDGEVDVAEEVVEKLCGFAGVEGFFGDDIVFEQRVVRSHVGHVPTVEVVKRDMVAHGKEFKPL